MKEIGGYFELELPKSQDEFLHSGCTMVNSGRHALEYILRIICDNVSKIWIPYYTCEVVLQPIKRLNINYDFYHISSKFELEREFPLKEGEYIIVNNYFGIKDKYINCIATKYGQRVIVDNAQAWYANESPGINSFYSPRKFFGMPDGGIACHTEKMSEHLKQDYSSERCSHLLKRIDDDASAGYPDFRSNSISLNNAPLRQMSKLSKRILSSIDFELVRTIRRSNYQILHDMLCSTNMLNLPSIEASACPMVYPYMTNDPSLRQRLIENKIFVATYWPNVLEWCQKDSTEYKLAKYLLPLPIDQRYNGEDMLRIIKIIKNESKNKTA